jgi:hypothetical protein
VTLGLPLLLVRFGLDYVVTRNVMFVAVPLAVLIAVGLAGGRLRWLGVATAVALCAIGTAAAVRVQSSATLQRPAWRAVATALGPADRNRAIVIAGTYRARPLKLYLPGAKFYSRHAVDEIDVVGMRSPHEPACWWGAQCNLPTARPSRAPPAPEFHLVSLRRLGAFTIVRFRSRRPVVLAHHSRVLESRRMFHGRRRDSRLVLFQPRRA